MMQKNQKSWIVNFFNNAINSPLAFICAVLTIISGQSYYKGCNSDESKLTNINENINNIRIGLYNARRSANEQYDLNSYTIQRINEVEKKLKINSEFLQGKSEQLNNNYLYLNFYNLTRGWNENNIISTTPYITDTNLIP